MMDRENCCSLMCREFHDRVIIHYGKGLRRCTVLGAELGYNIFAYMHVIDPTADTITSLE